VRIIISAALATLVGVTFTPVQAQAPEATYAQTRDWVTKRLVNFAGYQRADATITYKDISMDGCQLRFTTTTSSAAFTDYDTFNLSLASITTTHWGVLRDPSRAYVVFNTSTPVNFSHRRIWRSASLKGESYNINTSIAALELGQPGADYSDMAKQLKTAIVHAAELCRIQASNVAAPPIPNKPIH
jgi:hypothetical protein